MQWKALQCILVGKETVINEERYGDVEKFHETVSQYMSEGYEIKMSHTFQHQTSAVWLYVFMVKPEISIDVTSGYDVFGRYVTRG